MKKFVALLLAALLCLSLTAAMAEGDAIMDVYWIGKTLNNPWWISVADFATQEAEALGVNLTIAIPQEEVDLERQVSMIEAAVQSGAKALVISAASSDGVAPAIQAAREADLKIVNFDTRMPIRELRVDGGPTRNGYLMQFQSDMLNIPVRIPDSEELSGIGAAYAAGLSVGLYDDKVFEVLKRTSFTPNMTEDTRDEKYAGWQAAVRRTGSMD